MIGFAERVRDEAFARCGGRCECAREHRGQEAPHHGGRCPNTFPRNGKWEARRRVRVNSLGEYIVFDRSALCLPCHRLSEFTGLAS